MTSPYEEVVTLNIGEKAPDFSLPAHPEGTIALEDFRGKSNVILAFYPKDDTPGCTKEMCTFTERKNDFAAYDTVILGISCDSTESHAEFAGRHGLANALLADETRETGKAYGAVRSDRVIADRMLFVIDKSGIIRHIHSGMPDFDDLLEVAKALQDLQSERG